MLRFLAERGQSGDAISERVNNLAEIHGRYFAAGKSGGDARDERVGFSRANRFERLHAPRAEKLQNADLPELPPQIAVGTEGDVAAIVADDLLHQDLRPGCENQVVSFHNRFRRRRRRDDDGRNLAELDVHYWSVLLG